MLHYALTAETLERADQGWVGIWKPREQKEGKGKRSWVRATESFSEWGLWSTTHVIAAKGNKPRIVLLGESVARGFLYDHFFTPAEALRRCIDAEVVDLARTGMSREHLELMVRSCAVLEPDLIVILAGNNWAEDGHPLGRDDGKVAADVLRAGGVFALKQHLADTLRARALHTIKKVSELGAAQKTPILWVVPSANYEQWRFAERTAPLLEAKQQAEWLRSQNRAEALLQAKQFEQALEVAHAMTALDRGTSAASVMLAAQCERGLGHSAEAKRLCRVAADVQTWDLTPQNPRAVSAVRELLRTEAPKTGAMIVDADELVDGATDFLDYCHFTAEAIGKVFWKVAEVASARLGVAMSQTSRAAVDFGVTAELESRARFLAAVHAAHYGQSTEMIRGFLEDALQRWPAIAATMQTFIKLQIKRAPVWMCSELAALGQPTQLNVSRYLTSYAATDFVKLFDAALVEQMRLALTARGACDFDVEAARIREDGVGAEPTNLLDARYAPSYSHPDWWWWTAVDSSQTPRRHFLAGHTPSATFHFVASAGQSLRASIVARMAAGAQQGTCRVRLNGHELSLLELGAAWAPRHLRLPGEHVRGGVNALELVWPDFSGDGAALIERAAHELEEGSYPELLCERAHVHSLSVSLAG